MLHAIIDHINYKHMSSVYAHNNQLNTGNVQLKITMLIHSRKVQDKYILLQTIAEYYYTLKAQITNCACAKGVVTKTSGLSHIHSYLNMYVQWATQVICIYIYIWDFLWNLQSSYKLAMHVSSLDEAAVSYVVIVYKYYFEGEGRWY